MYEEVCVIMAAAKEVYKERSVLRSVFNGYLVKGEPICVYIFTYILSHVYLYVYYFK